MYLDSHGEFLGSKIKMALLLIFSYLDPVILHIWLSISSVLVDCVTTFIFLFFNRLSSIDILQFSDFAKMMQASVKGSRYMSMALV